MFKALPENRHFGHMANGIRIALIEAMPIINDRTPHLRAFPALSAAILLAAFSAGGCYEQTIHFSGRDMVGFVTLNGRASVESARSDVPEKIAFDNGVTLSHATIHDITLSCTTTNYAAVVLSSPQGQAGFKGSGDTVWNRAENYPVRLAPLDSLLQPTGTNPKDYLGSGLIHTRHVSFGCGQNQRMDLEAGYKRILYAKGRTGIYLKLQAHKLEVDSAQCGSLFFGHLCVVPKNVVFKFYLTKNAAGSFKDEPAAVRAYGKRIPGKNGSIFRYLNSDILGRLQSGR